MESINNTYHKSQRLCHIALLLIILMTGAADRADAQCKYPNTAFNPGEYLNYDLYFNWKFVWVKCGETRFSVTNSTYQGKKALRTDILFRSNKACEKFFPMRDTLISYTTADLVPLYFRKGAFEGKRYTVDEVWYTYPGGDRTHMKQLFRDPDGDILRHETDCDECVNDMLNILLLARSRDYTNFKEGQRMQFRMVTGKRLSNKTLIFKGREKFKANDGHTYRTLVFSLLNDKEKKEKELLRFYITDDENHLPIRIDFYLKFGVAKAYYRDGRGIRNAMTARIK